VKILERVEGKSSYGRGACECLEELGQLIGNVWFSSAAINGHGHVLLSFTEKCELGSSINRKAH
jgi:hypothetical protein